MRISDWSSDVCSSDLATARQILDLLPETSCLVFGLSPALLDALFRKARDTAALRDAELKKIHFHDSRREAATRLASKIDVMELARMGGWKNRSEEHTSELQSLMSISYDVFCLKKKIKD